MDLHIVPGSPPCSVALLVAKSLKLNLNVKTVNLLEGEHKKPEFLKVCSKKRIGNDESISN